MRELNIQRPVEDLDTARLRPALRGRARRTTLAVVDRERGGTPSRENHEHAPITPPVIISLPDGDPWFPEAA